MLRRCLAAFGISVAMLAVSFVAAPSEASAGWRGEHPGHPMMRPVYVGGPRFVPGPRFVRHQIWTHRVRVVHRPYFVQRRYVVRPAFYGPRFIRPAPILAYGPGCIIKRKLRWNRWGEPVRVVKRICY